LEGAWKGIGRSLEGAWRKPEKGAWDGLGESLEGEGGGNLLKRKKKKKLDNFEVSKMGISNKKIIDNFGVFFGENLYIK
jgi:hypothetical protein